MYLLIDSGPLDVDAIECPSCVCDFIRGDIVPSSAYDPPLRLQCLDGP